jgi:hypothetical protein
MSYLQNVRILLYINTDHYVSWQLQYLQNSPHVSFNIFFCCSSATEVCLMSEGDDIYTFQMLHN